MSLHAQLSPEAQERLAAQRRNSTISSLVISLLAVVLLGLVLAFILISPLFKETPTIVTYAGNADRDDDLEQKKMVNQIQRKPSAPSSSQARVIAAATTSPTAVPVPEIDVVDPSTDFGSGDDFGDGWGTADGGMGFGNIPATMRKRCSQEDRAARLRENGGTDKCEVAVVRALDWFQKSQAKDGSWGSSDKIGTTGIVLLAYLGHCETPLSEKYGDTVLRSMTYLIDVGMKKKGALGSDMKSNHWVYEHCIATYALAEGYTFCKQLGINVPNLETVVQKSGQRIIDGQNLAGGWTYRFEENKRNDTSVMGWALQALKACKHTGLDFRNMRSCIRGGLEALKGNQDSNGAIGYTNAKQKGDGTTLTSIGVLCYQMWDKESDSLVRKGSKLIDKNIKCKWSDKETDLYGHYYASQAMINRGGVEWKNYNKLFRDEVLKNQGEDGSWKTPANAGHGAKTTHLRNAFCTLMLEVYYRFLPGTGAGV